MRFKDEFNDIIQVLEDFAHWEWPTDANCFLARQATIVKTWITGCLKENTFPREDYLELCEPIAVFLGADVPGGFVIRRPGADHHARFMSKAIYYLKIYLLKNVFVLHGREKKEVDRMAVYVAICYGKYFLLLSSVLCNLH